jgi:hypothetical protein
LNAEAVPLATRSKQRREQLVFERAQSADQRALDASKV